MLQEDVAAQQLRKVELQLALHAGVVQIEVGTMIGVVGRPHHPVNEPMATMVESTHRAGDALVAVLHAELRGVVHLGAQSGIAIVGGTLVIEVGERGQTEAFVVGE